VSQRARDAQRPQHAHLQLPVSVYPLPPHIRDGLLTKARPQSHFIVARKPNIGEDVRRPGQSSEQQP